MLEQIPIFTRLPKEHLLQLKTVSRKIFAEKGSILFSPGDATEGFYAVLDGAVRVFRVSPKGKEVSLEIVGSGSIFAGASLFSDTYHCYAEALKESTVYLIRKDRFLEMIQTDPRFAAEWVRVLSLEVMHLRQRLDELTLKSPKARIASYILLLCEMKNTDSATLPAHRKSIATLLGMTHETFYRTAKELECESIVLFDGHNVKIVNRSMLEELME